MARRKVTDTREKKATLPDAPIEDVDFVQENIEAYRDYGNFANYFRAIPNVCDGFRYSHRRITYDMMLLKLTPDANYVKSARIVGDVLGRFHPHGDCLEGSTRLFLLSGQEMTIQDAYESGVSSLDVLSVDDEGNVVPAVAHSFRIGQKASKIYCVRLADGTIHRVTGNHQFRLIDGTWRQAKNLKKGDVISGGYVDNKRRPRVRSFGKTSHLIQYLVSHHCLGEKKAGICVHHEDRNPGNNSPSNLSYLSREAHAFEHREVFEKGLSNGLSTMFDSSSRVREAVRQKNSIIASRNNAVQGAKKAYQVCELIRSEGGVVNPDTYRLNRSRIYNAPLIETVISRGYISSEEEIASLKKPEVDLSDAIGLVSAAINEDRKTQHSNEQPTARSYESSPHRPMRVGQIVERSLLFSRKITKHTYEEARLQLIEENGSGAGSIYGRNFPSWDNAGGNKQAILNQCVGKFVNWIESVDVEELDSPEKMYDFTVDGFENMLIKSADLKDGGSSLTCVHNSSVYNTMVGMSQDFTYKYPFIDGHGNWGTLRDSAAAYRYTEARLTSYAEALLGRFPSSASRVFELDENTVPTRTVQAGYEQEPEVLPALFPNFVVNPILGIGAAMQSKTAGHNINEALAAAILIVDSPNARPATLREKIPGPDMPTSCDIFDTGDPRNGIESYMTTGRGSFIMRARYHFEDYQISARKKGTQIIVTGLPYGIDGEDVVEGTQALLAAGKLPQEISVADFTDRSGVRVVFDIAELDPQETINQLLFHSKPKKDKEGGGDDGKKGEGKVQSTFLQFSYAVNMNAIVNNEIRCIGVFDALREWVAHRRRVVKRRSTFRKDKAEARLHVVDGYLKAIPIAEKIIEKVRESNGREEAHKSLVSIWKFSDVQASAILDMSIIRIAKMGVKQLADEKANLEATIDDCSKLLNEPLYLNKRLKEEMRQIQKDLGRERTCRLMEGSADIEKPEEVFIEVPAEAGYLIRTKNNLLRWVARLSATPARLEGDIVVANDALDTNCAIECITSFGNHARMYPEDLTNRFTSAKMLFKDFLQPGENIVLAHSGFNWEYDGAPDLVMITEFGGVKRISFEEWNKHTTRRATDCITLDEGDSVVQAFFLPEGADIVVGTHNGLVIKIDSERVLAKGRKARSLPAIKLESGDSIAFAGASYEGYSVISYWTDEGNFAAFSVDEVKYQSRGGKGISLLSIQKGAHVVGGSVIYDAAGSDSVQVMYQDASGEMTEVDVPIRAMKLTKRTLTPLDGIGVSDVVHVSGTPYQEEHDNADE